MRKTIIRVLACVIGVLVATLSAELVVRFARPYKVDRAGRELRLFQGDQEGVRSLYTLDPEIRFRPRLGSRLYDENGFIRNEYSLERTDERERILFMGDSVTVRAKIIDALRELHGEESYEYWNGGVTAYNTAQEVAYFEKYTSIARPDHVVLTFHLNDFLRTPISFVDSKGRMQVITPFKDLTKFYSWLFANSHLYRYYAGATRDFSLGAPRQDIQQSLLRLKELTAAEGAHLSVIVMPHLEPVEEWHSFWTARYEAAMEIMRDVGVRHFTLLDSLERALKDGVDPEELPGDRAHPSAEVAAYFAEDLKEQGLFENR